MSLIAFIPVRAGSKSIPNKNIKSFCGKPLVYWVTKALQQTMEVDRIIIATDSSLIEEEVNSFGFSKIEIYRRLSDNAKDNSSTESVMLEYIKKNGVHMSEDFMLVQATSPFTTSDDLKNAIELYRSGKYESVLSCVRIKRFFWNDDGTSKNYDYQKRPRRQNFEGDLMENGAFYINKTGNIVKHNNRLSGNVGIFEMPEFTSIEIDESSDWIMAESLMKANGLAVKEKSDIKLFLTDVDGVLTDAGMYYSENGDELKNLILMMVWDFNY